MREVGIRDAHDNLYCSNFHVDHPCHLLDRHPGRSAFRPLLLDLKRENLVGLGLRVVPLALPSETPNVLI